MGDNCKIELEVEGGGRAVGCRIVPHYNMWYNKYMPNLPLCLEEGCYHLTVSTSAQFQSCWSVLGHLSGRRQNHRSPPASHV